MHTLYEVGSASTFSGVPMASIQAKRHQGTATQFSNKSKIRDNALDYVATISQRYGRSQSAEYSLYLAFLTNPVAAHLSLLDVRRHAVKQTLASLPSRCNVM